MLREQTAASPARMQKALAGLKAYQTALRVARRETGTVLIEIGGARLIDYGGSGRPLFVVPSLINPPYVVDLSPGNSLLEYLTSKGFRPLLLDWGDPRAQEGDWSIADHIEKILLPMLEMIGPNTALIGYCLGGTMALAAAARRPVAGLALLATPWDFNGFPDASRNAILDMWDHVRPTAQALGVLPLEVLQASFWQLDPERSIAKYEAFADYPADGAKAAAFVRLEDWANEGPPLSLAAGQELLDAFFMRNVTASGEWMVTGWPIDIASVGCPVLNVISTTDRIVPAAAAPRIGTPLHLEAGHVGMVVGRRAPHILWEPLADWLSQLR